MIFSLKFRSLIHTHQHLHLLHPAGISILFWPFTEHETTLKRQANSTANWQDTRRFLDCEAPAVNFCMLHPAGTRILSFYKSAFSQNSTSTIKKFMQKFALQKILFKLFAL